MNHSRITHRAARATPPGFTIVEMLVVISIIAILAAMIMPAISRARIRAQVAQARLQMSQISQAIHGYESDNNCFPITKEALASGKSDFTFGTSGIICAGTTSATGFKTPSGACQILATNSVNNYQTNNSEIMAILLDKETLPGTPSQHTCNFGHVRNPKKNVYLNATMASDTLTPGIGPDLVYRDPWGNPYIITIDTGYDEKSLDAFYRYKNISQSAAGSQVGLYGLVNSSDPAGNSDFFECSAPVMIWSAGPDKMVDPGATAAQGANRDNVLSWSQ